MQNSVLFGFMGIRVKVVLKYGFKVVLVYGGIRVMVGYIGL